jgi:glycosyltransferase involved in cell wall biosynthesis
MKIAVVAPTQMPSRRANTIQVAKMTQAFSKLGHEVILIYPSPGIRRSSLQGESEWNDFAIHYGLRTPFPVMAVPANPVLRRYDYAARAVRKARLWGAELVFTRLPQCAALASRRNLPTIYEIHDRPHRWAATRLLRIFLSAPKSLKLVVITHALANVILQDFSTEKVSSKLIVAPDGVDMARYRELRSPEQAREQLRQIGLILPDRFTVGYSGHLYSGRGIDLLLEVAGELTDCNFLITGGEPHHVSRYQRLVESKRLANVFLTGFVPNQELPLYQASCEALAMPYQNEVAASSGGDIGSYLSPMKAFEYMACGRVILSSDLPVFHEILNNNNAMLLPLDDPTAWIRAIQRIREDPVLAQRLGEQARQDVSQYSWEKRAVYILQGIT